MLKKSLCTVGAAAILVFALNACMVHPAPPDVCEGIDSHDVTVVDTRTGALQPNRNVASKGSRSVLFAKTGDTMTTTKFSIQQFLDEAACTRLCVDFANHIDARRYDAWLDLFADDGVLERMGTKMSGRTELTRFLEARLDTVETRHLCTNIRVTLLSPDEAAGFCYALFIQGATGVSGQPTTVSVQPVVVEYHDRYRRTPQGWRIQERSILVAMRP